jgi:hypothetical protein
LRWKLYPFAYAAADIPLSELAIPSPFPDLPFFHIPETQKYIETRLLYAVKTAEGRFSVVQVSDVFDDRIRLRYKTYEKPLPSVQLRGEFSCEHWHIPEVVTNLDNIRFEATPRPELRFQPDKTAPAAPTRLGRWKGTAIFPASGTGHFRATVENFRGTLSHHWHVAGTDLVDKQGSLDIEGHKVTYQVDGDTHLVLTLQSRTEMEFLVKITVNDELGNAVSASKCVKFDPLCRHDVNVIPVIGLQVAAFHEHFSVVRLPLAVARLTNAGKG